MFPKLRFFLIGGFFLASSTLQAEGIFPRVKVVPWNGHKAAASLTFDGSDPSQLDVAVPELHRRHLKATFFLTANHTTRKDEWRGILKDGNEIGNHTLDDFSTEGSIPPNAESEVVGARNVLQKEFGITLYTFAYPLIGVTSELKELVAKTHLLARGRGGKTNILTPSTDPDWMDIPSRETGPQIPVSTYEKWVGECFRTGGWLVWRIQGLDGAPTNRQPVPKEAFEKILDTLQSKDIWVGTFLEVGTYFRAEKIFEKATIQKSNAQENWTWSIPDHFPDRVFLKVRLSPAGSKVPGAVELWQGGQRLSQDRQGNYLVDFGLKVLTLRLSPKS